MNLLLLEGAAGGGSYALLRDGTLTDYGSLSPPDRVRPESLYLGKVTRVHRGLDALFVSLDKDLEGFLPLREIPGERKPGPGDALLVQVRRPPQGGKAAFLSAEIALPGSLAVLLPLGGGLRLSSRIGGRQERERLTRLAAGCVPEGMGLVLRARALSADGEALRAQAEALRSLWGELRRDAAAARAPVRLREGPGPLEVLLRDSPFQPDRAVSDGAAPGLPEGLPLERHPAPFALWGVREQLARALRRRVYLKSGGTLVIDPCEAMTVIDVNSAGSAAAGGKEQAALALNLEAAGEIARLLRLRRTGGMVLIDFIDMQAQADRDAVLARLCEALREDRVKTVVHGFTALGLVELTRKRSQDALAAERLRPCPACGGSGLETLPEAKA